MTGYFDAAYFDAAYFDTGVEIVPIVGGGLPIRDRPPKPDDDDDLLFWIV